MIKNKKLILQCLIFAFIYILVLQQAILLLTDYTQVEVALLYKFWQTHFSLIVLNLLVIHTTKKYFKSKQNIYLPLTIGIASGVLPITYAYAIPEIWTFLFGNIFAFGFSLIINKALEKVSSKTNQESNN